MKQSKSNIISVASKEQSGLSKGQQTFNKLIRKIETERQRLAEWQATIGAYQTQYGNEFMPLLRTFDELRMELVRLLDQHHAAKGFTRNQRNKISDIICELALGLIADYDDAGLKEIYNRHSASDFDALLESEREAMKTTMEGMFDVELDDDFEVGSPQEMMAQLAKKMQEKYAQQDGQTQGTTPPPQSRKKSAKALAQEAREQEDAKNISQSLREVFRKLASALHPDKEQDPAERERKTVLMQRVNVAYGKKDLLQLLELQLEIEQIDQTMISTLSDDRLKHYNKILTEQVNELGLEIRDVEFGFMMRFNLNVMPGARLSPKQALSRLKKDIQAIQMDITGLKHELTRLQDAPGVKEWIRYYEFPSQRFDEDDFFW
jgi:hypothetical protein